MKLLFKESFIKDLNRISESNAIAQIKQVTTAATTAHTLQEIRHIKKLNVTGNYFRIRVGQYRIGLIVEKDEILFVRCLHRREIYRYFP